VKISNRSRIIDNGPVKLVTRPNISSGCCLVPVTHKCGSLHPDLATTTLITDEVSLVTGVLKTVTNNCCNGHLNTPLMNKIPICNGRLRINPDRALVVPNLTVATSNVCYQ
jgi:hypothetical protein